MAGQQFELSVVGNQQYNVGDDNVDVEVRFPDGSRYVATFFTLTNIATLFNKNRETGECLGGLYFWAADMIIVESLEPGTLVATVSGLLEDDEFFSAFSSVPNEGAIEE